MRGPLPFLPLSPLLFALPFLSFLIFPSLPSFFLPFPLLIPCPFPPLSFPSRPFLPPLPSKFLKQLAGLRERYKLPLAGPGAARPQTVLATFWRQKKAIRVPNLSSVKCWDGMCFVYVRCQKLEGTNPLVVPEFNKKAQLPQRWPRDAPYIRMPWKFSRVPEYAKGYFCRNF